MTNRTAFSSGRKRLVYNPLFNPYVILYGDDGWRSTRLKTDRLCAVLAFLNASHIIPWSDDPERRADHRNGICLNARHDRTFDQGRITFDVDLRVVVPATLKHVIETAELSAALAGYAGRQLQVPVRLTPYAEALAYHRAKVFVDT